MTSQLTPAFMEKLRRKAIEAKTVEDWGCDSDNFHDNATPDVVLALLDALEAGNKRIAEQDREIDSLATVAGSNATMVKQLTSRAESAEQALLLERQKEVIVKLPMPYDINVAGERIDWDKGDHYDRDEVLTALAAAGISLQKGDE